MAGKRKNARTAETPAQRFKRVIEKVAARDQRARARREKRLREMAGWENENREKRGAAN